MYLQHLPPCVQVFYTAEIVLGELNIGGRKPVSELIDLMHLFFKGYNFCLINLCKLNINKDKLSLQKIFALLTAD